jgi:Tfp pilus assembly PilM family ATPase
VSRAPLPRLAAFLERVFVAPPTPLGAVEVRGGGLGLARFRRQGGRLRLEAAASLALPAGSLALSATEPNVLDAGALTGTLRALVERVGLPPGGRVALVLPDVVARVRTLPASELRGRGLRETQELVRFRLQKSALFDVHQAVVAHAAAAAGPDGPQTLAAAIFRPVLEGYERALEAAGLDVGIVEPASLALLAGLPLSQLAGDRLLVHWEPEYVSFVLARDGAVLWYRTLPAAVAASADDVAREAASTRLYYEERLRGPGLAGVRLRATAREAAEAAACLTPALGQAPQAGEWEPADDRGLAAAVACIRGRAA